VRTLEDVRTWSGRTAQDPYGVPLGTIAGTLHDEETGSPEWLVISPDDSDAEGVLVPVGGALPTGKRIRVVPIVGVVRAAPRVHVGEDIDVAAKRRAAAHYGLALDSEASGSGQLREPAALRREAVAEPAGATPPAGEPWQRAQILQALQAAHAMEQASLRLLAAMRWRLQDEELVHDVALHHKATNRHAERLRERLDELEAGRGRPFEWAARTVAYVQAQVGRLRSHPDPTDLRQAHALEQGGGGARGGRAPRAGAAAPPPTAALARANRADELAMVMTIEQSRLWPGRNAPSGGPAEEAPAT
jgi:hypothetical protein